MIAEAPRPLAELRRDGDLRLHFHPGQARAWLSPARFTFMLAGTQGGKTSFGPHWLYREIRDCGPGDYLAVTSTFPLLKLKMLPEFRGLFEHTLHLGTWHATDKVFEFHDGTTRVIFGSASNSDSLESATAKAAWLDEAGQDDFRLESWEAILRRLSLHQGRVLAGTTVYNIGWIKQQVYDRWREGDPDYRVIQFDSTENPAFPRAEYERAERTLPGWKFAMFYRGLFSRPAGLIYEDYRDEPREDGGHVVPRFALPPAWPRYVGLDFGPLHTALIWLAHDPETDVYYAYRESLDGGKTTPEHAAAALEAAKGTNVVAWWGGSASEHQYRWDWRAAGVTVKEPPDIGVEPGIDRVTALWKAHRLYVFADLKGLRSELGTYSRVVGPDGQTTEAIKDKQTFHRLDALRYVAAGLGGKRGMQAW